jgi:hypothetical protein
VVADQLHRGLVVTARALALVVGSASVIACIDAPGSEAPPACTATTDCNAVAGEVCDEGVCWGDPPAGMFAAVLSPAAGADAARTELPDLAFSASGWMIGDPDGPGALVLASTVRVRGSISAPCPAGLAECDTSFAVPATVRFARPSAIDERRVVFEATTSGPDYQVVLPRPTTLTSYQVTITPSDVPIAPGRPSPAELIAPRRLAGGIDPAGGDDVRLELVLTDVAAQRALSGSLVRPPPAGAAGWRVHAEAPSLDENMGFERVSNIARADAAGSYRLWLPVDRGPVDLVVSPPAVTGSELPAPGLRRRGLDVVDLLSLPAITLPPPGEVITVGVSVTGINGGGDNELIDGARVVARMDQSVAPDLFLVHRVITSTNERGVAALLLWSPPLASMPAYEYALDVLPASGVEQASRFGTRLALEGGTAPSLAIELDRREPIRGQILDEHGAGVGGATVGATLSAETRCELAAADRLLARALPTLTATTAPDGSFVLWVDKKLFGKDLRYDVHVEPTPDTAPSWTYGDIKPGGDLHAWQLPPAAHVRGDVRLADGRPAADTLVQLYARVEPVACANQPATPPAAAEVWAVGRVDADGVVRMVLPRRPVATPR